MILIDIWSFIFTGKLSTPRPSASDLNDNANSSQGSSSGRFLLREDDVMQLEFNTNGLFSRSKPRRLILLNDLLVCVAVNGRSSEVDPSTTTSSSANERLTLKWAVPVSDVEVTILYLLFIEFGIHWKKNWMQGPFIG